MSDTVHNYVYAITSGFCPEDNNLHATVCDEVARSARIQRYTLLKKLRECRSLPPDLARIHDKISACGSNYNSAAIHRDRSRDQCVRAYCRNPICPRCSAYAAVNRYDIITAILGDCYVVGIPIYFLTLNLSFPPDMTSLKSRLAILTCLFKSARDLMGTRKNPGFKRVIQHFVWFMEIEHAKRGWFPHFHILFTAKPDFQACTASRLSAVLQAAWKKVSARAGCFSYVLDVQPVVFEQAGERGVHHVGGDLASYLAKGSFISTASTADPQALPFNLLEYLVVVKGKRNYAMSKGFREVVAVKESTESAQSAVLWNPRDVYVHAMLGASGLLPLELEPIWYFFAPRIIQSLDASGMKEQAQHLADHYAAFLKRCPKAANTAIDEAALWNYRPRVLTLQHTGLGNPERDKPPTREPDGPIDIAKKYPSLAAIMRRQKQQGAK